MFKFLKKFKDKILIAFACCFIGIGTILSYTLETKAYVSNEFTSSCSTYVYNNRTWYYNPNISNNSDYYLLVNYTISNTSSYNPIYLQSINMSNNSSSQISTFDYYNSSFEYNTYIFKILNERLSPNYAWGFTSPYGYTFNIVNIDIVPQNEIYLYNYVENYQQQLQALQGQYDTLENNYDTLQGQYETLENNYDTLQGQYETLENNYEQKQNEYDMLSNGQLGYLSYMEFYINNQSIEFGNDSETELNLNELIEYNLYANNSLNLSFFTTQQVNPNYLPLTIISYYDELPVNLFNMYFNGVTSGIIKVGYYNNSQYTLKQISFDNTGTAVDSINSSLINYEVFKGLNVDYIEYIEIQFNNADLIAGSINFNSTYNIAYSSGYTNGYNYGYNVSDNVNSEKIENARQEGYQNGYDVGKQDGIAIGSNENNTLYGMVIRSL